MCVDQAWCACVCVSYIWVSHEDHKD